VVGKEEEEEKLREERKRKQANELNKYKQHIQSFFDPFFTGSGNSI
jgi:hypothetical protein